MQRNLRQQLKAETRLELLRSETRHQLLLQKELEQKSQQLQHRLNELSPVYPVSPLMTREQQDKQEQANLLLTQEAMTEMQQLLRLQFPPSPTP